MKYLMTTTAILFCLSVRAQTEQGGWLVSSSTGLSFTSTSIDGASDNTNAFNLIGGAGYFAADNLSTGLIVVFNNTSIGDQSSRSVAIGPWIRYYVEGTFFAGISYQVVTSKVESGGFEATGSGGQFLIEAGYPIFVRENIAVEPSVSYLLGTGDSDGLTIFSLGVGFSLFLPGK